MQVRATTIWGARIWTWQQTLEDVWASVRPRVDPAARLPPELFAGMVLEYVWDGRWENLTQCLCVSPAWFRATTSRAEFWTLEHPLVAYVEDALREEPWVDERCIRRALGTFPAVVAVLEDDLHLTYQVKPMSNLQRLFVKSKDLRGLFSQIDPSFKMPLWEVSVNGVENVEIFDVLQRYPLRKFAAFGLWSDAILLGVRALTRLRTLHLHHTYAFLGRTPVHVDVDIVLRELPYLEDFSAPWVGLNERIPDFLPSTKLRFLHVSDLPSDESRRFASMLPPTLVRFGSITSRHYPRSDHYTWTDALSNGWVPDDSFLAIALRHAPRLCMYRLGTACLYVDEQCGAWRVQLAVDPMSHIMPMSATTCKLLLEQS